MSKMSNAILQVLRESEGHMTADAVLKQCQLEGINSSTASVYRNLNLLVDQGLIGRLKMVGMPDVFDKTPTPHSHAVCTNCGKVTDAHMDSLLPLIQEQTNLQASAYFLQINHLCEDCAQ